VGVEKDVRLTRAFHDCCPGDDRKLSAWAGHSALAKDQRDRASCRPFSGPRSRSGGGLNPKALRKPACERRRLLQPRVDVRDKIPWLVNCLCAGVGELAPARIGRNDELIAHVHLDLPVGVEIECCNRLLAPDGLPRTATACAETEDEEQCHGGSDHASADHNDETSWSCGTHRYAFITRSNARTIPTSGYSRHAIASIAELLLLSSVAHPRPPKTPLGPAEQRSSAPVFSDDA
jgi:hypothetical protein